MRSRSLSAGLTALVTSSALSAAAETPQDRAMRLLTEAHLAAALDLDVEAAAIGARGAAHIAVREIQ